MNYGYELWLSSTARFFRPFDSFVFSLSLFLSTHLFGFHVFNVDVSRIWSPKCFWTDARQDIPNMWTPCVPRVIRGGRTYFSSCFFGFGQWANPSETSSLCPSLSQGKAGIPGGTGERGPHGEPVSKRTLFYRMTQHDFPSPTATHSVVMNHEATC